MGMVSSLLFGPSTGRTDDPDPVTGLTSRDRYLVTTSWGVVRKNTTENGVRLLMLLFKNHPEYINLFPFRDIPLEDLPQNKRFQAHCNSVMYSMSSIVDNVGNSDLLVTILLKVGESHKPRKATEKSFNDVKEALLQLFGTFMNKSEIEAWKKTADVAFGVICKGLTE